MADLSTEPGLRATAADPPDARAHGQALERLAAIFGLWLGVVLFYWPSAVALDGFWTDTIDKAYTHGYLILITSAWLVVRARRRLAAVPIRPEPRALLAILAMSALWLYCWRAALQDPQLLLLPALLFAAIIAALGRRVARVLLFPIGFLYFAMPAWSDLNGVLQLMSVKVNDGLIWLTGIPALLQGDFIHLAGGTLEIAEGCSGLHFFVVGLSLAALYGEMAEDPPRRRLAWLAIMGVLSIIANWVRIFIIVVAAYMTDMKTYLVTVSHYWFGWAVFVVVFVGFLWAAGPLARRWDRRRPQPVPAAAETSPAAAPARVGMARVLLALACLAVLPAAVLGADLAFPITKPAVAIVWPAPPAGWSGPGPVRFSDWTPQFLNTTAVSFKRYVGAGGVAVELYTAAYRTQNQDGKLLGYWNSILGGTDRLHRVSIRIARSPVGAWRELSVANEAGERSLIWYRYAIGTRRFVDPRLSQLWYGIAAFTGRPVSSVMALRAICAPGCAAARARLAAAAVTLLPTVRAEVQP